MRSLLTAFASSAVLSFGLLAFTASDAHADEQVAPKPAGVAMPATAGEKTPADDDSADIKHISLELNPLSASIGRYSIQGEYVLARHHAITLNPFYAHASVKETINGTDIDGGSLSGFGGELGYRFYTGSKGANGFFIGPSVLFASYTSSAPAGVPGATDSSFTSLGGAVDIGGQFILGPGIVLGFGFGLQYTSTSKDIDTTNLNFASAALAGDGVRPRFLLAVGYSF
jgi:hypothetical protein